MVDVSELSDSSDGEEEQKKSKKSKSKSKKKKGNNKGSSKPSSNSNGNAEPYSLSEGEKVGIGGDESLEMHEDSKPLAEMGGDIGASRQGGSSIGAFKQRQQRELREFYSGYVSDISDTADKLSDGEPDLNVFTLAFQAAAYNLANQRVGITEVLMNEFGMDKYEAVSEANNICQEAGEGQMLEDLLSEMTEKFSDA